LENNVENLVRTLYYDRYSYPHLSHTNSIILLLIL